MFLRSENARGKKAFPLKRAPISWVLLVPGRAGGCWYFAVFPGAYVLYRVGVPVTHRVAGTRSCRGVVHGVSSGRGHAIVPRGRIRGVLPARASLARNVRPVVVVAFPEKLAQSFRLEESKFFAVVFVVHVHLKEKIEHKFVIS